MKRGYVFIWVVLLATITLFDVGMVTLHTESTLLDGRPLEPVAEIVVYALVFGLTALGYVGFAVEIWKARRRGEI